MNWNFFTISTAALAITSFTLSVLLLAFGKTRLHRIWGLYNLSVTVWGVGGFFAGFYNNPQISLISWRIAHLGVVTIPIFLLHGISLFCGLKKNIFLKLAYIQGFFFILTIPSGDFFSGIKLVFSEFYYPILGRLYYPFLLIWVCIVVISQTILIINYKSSSGLKKMQIRYLVAGLILGFSGGITNFLPGIFPNIYPFGNFGIILYNLVIAYAIFKHRLLDISVVITRASIFIAVYSLVLGFPLALAFGSKEKLISLVGTNWWMVPLIASTLLATICPFIYLYIDKKAEDRLLKEQRSYQNVLRNASSGMIRIKELRRLLELVMHVVTKTVRIKSASIYLLDSESNRFKLQVSRGTNQKMANISYIDINSPLVINLTSEKRSIITEELAIKFKYESQAGHDTLFDFMAQLIELGAALIIPSFVDDKLIAFLVLGEKKSGKLYSQDDLIVFSVLANQAALAIENAQFYEEIKRTHEQLFQAEKMATIGTMADGLSHQINNRFHALSLISGDALDILKTYDPSNCSDDAKQVLSDLRGSLERIEANVLQGGEVVKGLLKYSRPGESGFELVDFNDVLNGSIDMVQYKIKLKEVDLVRNIPADLSKFHGNLTQLQEVFFNLIDNAYDATKERESTLKEEGFKSRIEIIARNVDGSLEIVVSDNGMGVKDLDKKKLFTPFFTTKATAKKGTGLGLYVIEKIVTSHNGKISIDSVYQSGTRFTITLPISPKAA